MIQVATSILGNIPKALARWLEESEIREQAEIIKNTALLRSTEKSRGHLKRLAVTWSPMKDHQLILM